VGQGVDQVDGLTRKLAEQRQLEPQLSAQVATLTAAMQAAQQDADAWAAGLQAALAEERRVQAQEPPPRLTVHNPKWDEWQALMTQLQQVYDSRVADAVAPEADVTRTQAALDDFDRNNPKPDEFILDPPRRPQRNPEYAEWVLARKEFVDAHNAAVARVQPYRDAISRAYGDLINALGTQPPTSIEVDNPAHAVWSDQLAKASLAVGNATLRANRAATALASAQAALAGPAANLALVRSLLATLPGELSAAQAAIAALVAARDSAASAQAVAELRVAVVLDQVAPDHAVVTTFQALSQSLGEAEAELRAFEDEFAPADDELWRLQARIGELQRVIAQAAADTQKVNDAEADYNRKAQAVQDKLNSRPRP
jgi:chromosome segregation ATPase